MTNTPAMAEKKVHEGRNVKRIREILGIKQDALALDLGLSQQAISQLEQKEALDAEMLEKVAKALKVPAEAIRNFSEEAAIFHIQNMHDNSQAVYEYHFNPIDKIIELYESKIRLYERMLEDKNEMVEKLEGLLKSNK